MIKPAAGYRPLAYSTPEAVQTTGTVVPSGPFAERLRFTARLDDAQKTAGHRDPSSTNLYGSLSC
jgi:hypothetical protein